MNLLERLKQLDKEATPRLKQVVSLFNGHTPNCVYISNSEYRPRIMFEGKEILVARLVLMIKENLDQLSAREYACHSCDDKRCCNPGHIFLGTPKDNVTDMLSKGRGNFEKSFDARRNLSASVKQSIATGKLKILKGSDAPRAKLTLEQVAAIRLDPRFQRDIAADYGVSQRVIHRIKTNKSYRKEWCES